MESRKIKIKEDYIKLDSLLKYAGLVSTGGHAKNIIQEGMVKVNGIECLQRGKKIKPGDEVKFQENIIIID